MTITLDQTFAASEDVVSREVNGEMVLLDLASGEYFGLAEVGCRIWDLLSIEARSLADLCDVVEAEYEAPRDLIEADVLALATDLEARDLIVSVG